MSFLGFLWCSHYFIYIFSTHAALPLCQALYKMLTHLMLITLWGKFCYSVFYWHRISGTERLSNLLKVTQALSGEWDSKPWQFGSKSIYHAVPIYGILSWGSNLKRKQSVYTKISHWHYLWNQNWMQSKW